MLNTSQDQLSLTLSALADPTRRAMLARLAAGEATVTELAAPFDISMPAISRHLKVLEHAGLITRGRDAQWRPCRLEAAPLRGVDTWVEQYRRFWEESSCRLDGYLHDLQTKSQSKSQLKPQTKEPSHARTSSRKGSRKGSRKNFRKRRS